MFGSHFCPNSSRGVWTIQYRLPNTLRELGLSINWLQRCEVVNPNILISASFYTSYEYKHFLWNTPALLLCVIPKLPQLHGVRVFGINKYWTKLLHNICSICAPIFYCDCNSFNCNWNNLVRSCIFPHMYIPKYSNKTIAQKFISRFSIRNFHIFFVKFYTIWTPKWPKKAASGCVHVIQTPKWPIYRVLFELSHFGVCDYQVSWIRWRNPKIAHFSDEKESWAILGFLQQFQITW